FWSTVTHSNRVKFALRSLLKPAGYSRISVSGLSILCRVRQGRSRTNRETAGPREIVKEEFAMRNEANCEAEATQRTTSAFSDRLLQQAILEGVTNGNCACPLTSNGVLECPPSRKNRSLSYRSGGKVQAAESHRVRKANQGLKKSPHVTLSP